MCGIFAVAGEDAGQRVLEGLKRLEYRGYDSWGVGVLSNGTTPVGQLKIEKHTGKIGAVQSLQLPRVLVALGHTRWATHGGVTQTNAHPHVASDESFLLVQNGVVENYQSLKHQLEKSGYTFKTQTDTEVIVALLEQAQQLSGRLGVQEVVRVIGQLEGRSTVGVLTRKGELLAFRLGSPLIVARNPDGEIFLSSDVLSVAAEASEYYAVANGELVEIIDGKVKVYNSHSLKKLSSRPKAKPIIFQPIDVQAMNLDKEGFPHFMLKEIFEQPRVLHAALNTEPDNLIFLAKTIKGAKQVFVVGAGSAAYIAGSIAQSLRRIGVFATEVKAYEAQSFLPLVKPGAICLAISQSGETADTLEAVEAFKARGAVIASIVNMSGSSLTALSDIACMLGVGPEVGVASTKALTGQLAWGRCLGELVHGGDFDDCRQVLERVETVVGDWLEKTKVPVHIRQLAEQLQSAEHLFVLGRGQLCYPALEFALKMKEISYIHTEGFSAGELKHGPLALIEQGTPVVCLIAEDEEKANMISAAAEVKARGARVIGVSATTNPAFDIWIPVPDITQWNLAAIPMLIVSQLLTYEIALLKGNDPDKPRNLAKSVTVK